MTKLTTINGNDSVAKSNKNRHKRYAKKRPKMTVPILPPEDKAVTKNLMLFDVKILFSLTFENISPTKKPKSNIPINR